MSRYIKKAKKVLAPGEVATSSESGDFSDVTATSVTTGYVESNNTRIRVNEDDKFTRQEGEKWVVIDYCDVWDASVSDVTWTNQNFSQYDEIKLTWRQQYSSCWNYNNGKLQFGDGSVLAACCYCYTYSQWTSYAVRNCYTGGCGACYNSQCASSSECKAVFEASIMLLNKTCGYIGGNFVKKAGSGSDYQNHGTNQNFYLRHSNGWENFNTLKLVPSTSCRDSNFGCYELLGKIKNTGVTCYED